MVRERRNRVILVILGLLFAVFSSSSCAFKCPCCSRPREAHTLRWEGYDSADDDPGAAKYFFDNRAIGVGDQALELLKCRNLGRGDGVGIQFPYDPRLPKNRFSPPYVDNGLLNQWIASGVELAYGCPNGRGGLMGSDSLVVHTIGWTPYAYEESRYTLDGQDIGRGEQAITVLRNKSFEKDSCIQLVFPEPIGCQASSIKASPPQPLCDLLSDWVDGGIRIEWLRDRR